MSETLSNQGTDKVTATEQTNVTGQMTPILGFSPNDGLLLTIRGGIGIPLVMDLRDPNGDQLPLDTKVRVEYDAPHLDTRQVVSETLSNIQAWRTLSVKEQQNEEYRDRTRVGLKDGYKAVEVRDIDELALSVESSKVVDWSQSRVYVDKDHTTVSAEN